MKEPAERKTRGGRHSSNIIFNLLALALLLTVIVFLHQILKKPKQTTEQQTTQEIKAVAPLPAATPPPAPETAAAEPAAQVTLPTPAIAPAPAQTEAEPVVEIKKEEETVIQKPAKKLVRAKRVQHRAEQEISPAELDGEDARRGYLEENRRLSSGDAKIEKSPTSELDREAARRFEAPSGHDLDDETARQRYLEENKRLSRLVSTGQKQQAGSSGTDEYIPFEDR